MTRGGNILLVGDAPVVGPLAPRVGGRLTALADPYDALLEMERRRWPTVLLTAPQADFPALCRASRRLQPGAALFGICPPAAEPQVRPLTGKILTDYFIAPLQRRDVDQIIRAWRAGVPRPDERPQGPSADVFARLLDAAGSISALEARLAECVGERVGVAVRWVEASNIPRGAKPLLLAAEETPRALVPDAPGVEVPAQAQQFLTSVQRCLPALLAAARRTEALHRLAITDPLTGAYNRRYFYHVTDQILLRAGPRNFRVTLLLYDIDDFKRYNDAYGYAAGDEILRDIAALMKQTTRKHDIVARIGGDEFAVLFWDFDAPRSPGSRPPETAYALSDRLLRAVRRHEFSSLGPDSRGALTISGGLARYPVGGTTCRELLQSADKALKEVKRTGKNAIHLFGQE